MKSSRHVIASLSTATVVWLFTKSLYGGLVCFACGVLIDVDHIIEYIIHHGWEDLTIKKVYRACEQTTRQEGELIFRRLYLVFHSVEIAILFLGVSIYMRNIYLLAISLGYSIHLIMDCAGNSSMYPYSYFIVWRAINGFNTDRFFKKL